MAGTIEIALGPCRPPDAIGLSGSNMCEVGSLRDSIVIGRFRLSSSELDRARILPVTEGSMVITLDA